MKKLLPLLALGTIAYADMSTQEFLYKDPRIMGMGAANTAVGGYSTAVFYNPAGLINIKKSHGVEVELLGLSVSSSKDTKKFIDDVSDAKDTEVVDTVAKYSGEVFNVTASNYTSVSYHTESDWAYSIGLLASADANFIPHSNSGSNGLLETHSRAYGGVVLGLAKRFDNVLAGDITIGIGAKYISQKSYEAGLDAGEVTDNKDDLIQYLQDTYEVKNSGVGADIGLLYSPHFAAALKPSLGVSLMNVGTLNFDDSYGAQPMTLNFGASISPEISWLNSFKVAVDYVDALNAQQARIRNYNPYRSDDQYDNADIEFDAMQHIRAGISVGLVDNSWFMMTLNGGLYQGAYTAGADLQLAVLKLQFATYQEQLGAKTGQLEDRRYVVGLGIGW
ncbi:hypothetical protein MNB_SM-6-42 [hydrothermal vent metagenome]|uniref:Uncharacterized protein n=1 Tax=hydrothermal vent metagenome TaxID=652676 RepID=A0A1W1CWL5_9ZZZZ